jgi:membrane protein DedA with SNARE-associated domain
MEWISLSYAGVFVAAAVEGEIVFVAASALAAHGVLDPVGVLVAGALGGSAGDQAFFYALRGGPAKWISRWPVIARRRDAIVSRVRKHASAMILACRFLPGLRIAIPVACAYAGVAPLRFSMLSVVSAVGWAAAVMAIVTGSHHAWLGLVGPSGWWTLVVPLALIVIFVRWLGRLPEKALEDDGALMTDG